tara:strand:+ start:254 stop:832 length:579 start_codon:yes stop_codon:yes gene_type:complete
MSFPAHAPVSFKSGLTLLEILLALVIIVIVAGISIPNISGSYGNTKLITVANNIERLSRYSRGNAILREKNMNLVIDTEKRLIFVGEEKNIFVDKDSRINNLEIIERLGYVSDTNLTVNVEKEIFRSLPGGLKITYIEINQEQLSIDEIFYQIQFFSNGQCELFRIILSNKNKSIEIYSDNVSGKVTSKFVE